MNKKQLFTILQSCLFAFDGLSKQEIIALNDNSDEKLVEDGINLLKFLQENLK